MSCCAAHRSVDAHFLCQSARARETACLLHLVLERPSATRRRALRQHGPPLSRVQSAPAPSEQRPLAYPHAPQPLDRARHAPSTSHVCAPHALPPPAPARAPSLPGAPARKRCSAAAPARRGSLLPPVSVPWMCMAWCAGIRRPACVCSSVQPVKTAAAHAARTARNSWRRRTVWWPVPTRYLVHLGHRRPLKKQATADQIASKGVHSTLGLLLIARRW